MYVPPNFVLSGIIQYLKNEIGTAQNIRLRTTRKNVLSALSVLVGKLKQMGLRSPNTGFIMFSGVSVKTNKNEFFLIVPPKGHKINNKIYQCDSRFVTENLEQCLLEQDIYGLITLDARDALVAILKGTNIEIIKVVHSASETKQKKAGGMSADRYKRLFDGGVHQFLHRIAYYAKSAFIEDIGKNESIKVKGILIGGSGLTKIKFVKGNYLDPRLKAILLKVVDISYSANKEGLRELIKRAQDKLTGVRYLEEKRLVQTFLEHLYRYTGLASYGEQEIRNEIELGAIDTLLLSQDLNKLRIFVQCERCEKIMEYTAKAESIKKFNSELTEKTCPLCKSANLGIIERKDLILDLGIKADESGAKIELISSETEEGMQLLQMGGICGIRRYKK